MRESGRRCPLEKLASWITDHVGTMGFFVVILVWTAIWLGWNLLAPARLRFDPPSGFVFWLFISNMIQLLLMPLIMVGQNIHGRYSEARAEHDLQVNLKAEKEIEVVLHHLERQNDMLIAMLGSSASGARIFWPGVERRRLVRPQRRLWTRPPDSPCVMVSSLDKLGMTRLTMTEKKSRRPEPVEG